MTEVFDTTTTTSNQKSSKELIKVQYQWYQFIATKDIIY